MFLAFEEYTKWCTSVGLNEASWTGEKPLHLKGLKHFSGTLLNDAGFRMVDGYGASEVVVESPRHNLFRAVGASRLKWFRV